MKAFHCLPSRGLRVTIILHVFVVALSTWGSWPAAAEEHRRRIYFLESLAPTQPAATRTIDGFEKRLSERTSEKFEIFIDYMDLGRFPSQAHIESTVHYLAQKYAEAPPDVLIPLGRAAIPFMIKYRTVIAPGVPVIIADVPARAVADGKALADTVWVATEYNFAKTLELARRLQPEARNLVFIAGASEYDRLWLNDARDELRPYLNGYMTKYLAGLRYDEMLREVSKLSPDTIVLMSLVFVDGDGLPQTPPDVAAAVANAAAAPVYSPLSSFFGRGIVGGYMDSFEAHGVAAADLAYEILSGKPIAELPHQTEPLHRYKADARELARWGISESRLPPGSEILFREPSAWEQYKAQILAITAAILAQAFLIAWLLHERQYRRRAERTARETFSELEQMNRMATAGELSAAITHEIKQPITGIVTMANAALRWISRENPDIGRAREAMNKVVAAGHHASDVITNVRGLFGKDTQKKVPTDINKLIRTVLGLVHIDLRKHGIESQVNLSEQLPPIIGNEVQLQQVILNLVMNAIESMHLVQPRMLSIKSETTGHDSVCVSIADTGRGIDVANLSRIFQPMFTTKARGMGMGLSICKSIIEAHNGRIWASINAPRGSIFHFELPMYRGGERKSDLGCPTLAAHNDGLASAPSLADESVE